MKLVIITKGPTHIALNINTNNNYLPNWKKFVVWIANYGSKAIGQEGTPSSPLNTFFVGRRRLSLWFFWPTHHHFFSESLLLGFEAEKLNSEISRAIRLVQSLIDGPQVR